MNNKVKPGGVLNSRGYENHCSTCVFMSQKWNCLQHFYVLSSVVDNDFLSHKTSEICVSNKAASCSFTHTEDTWGKCVRLYSVAICTFAWQVERSVVHFQQDTQIPLGLHLEGQTCRVTEVAFTDIEYTR